MARTGFERARRAVSALALVAFVAAALLNAPPERPKVNEAMEIVGFALLIVAMVGRIWSALYLSGRKSKVLCTAGPYSITRNPLYFFSFLAAVAIGLLTESFTLLAVLSGTYLLYYHFVMRHEEQRLAELFGEAFETYRRRVPRLVPWRLGTYEPADELTVRVKSFMRSVLDASAFLWAFFVFEAAEALATGYQLKLPVLWHLP